MDLRKDSPTYGQWDAVELSAENGLSVFISEGLGHAILSLEDGSVANYLCTSEYAPDADRTINPLSAKLAIAFESSGITKFSLSEKDAEAAEF